MKKLNLKIRSEEGAASVLEAIIVYPIVFIVVALLLILGFTYVQEGYLNYEAQSLSDYIVKTISYPGYANIEKPKYEKNNGAITIGDINAAMGAQAPYRYLFGFFNSNSGIKDNNGDNLALKYVNYMADDYLSKHGFLKGVSGEIDFFDAYDKVQKRRTRVDSEGNVIGSVEFLTPDYLKENDSSGYLCAINASTSQVEVYMAQNYVFSKMFNMIRLGNKKMYITATGMSAVSDSLELVKTTDMATDMATFLAKKLGFDMSKIKTLKDIIQGNK